MIKVTKVVLYTIYRKKTERSLKVYIVCRPTIATVSILTNYSIIQDNNFIDSEFLLKLEVFNSEVLENLVLQRDLDCGLVFGGT